MLHSLAWTQLRTGRNQRIWWNHGQLQHTSMWWHHRQQLKWVHTFCNHLVQADRCTSQPYMGDTSGQICFLLSLSKYPLGSTMPRNFREGSRSQQGTWNRLKLSYLWGWHLKSFLSRHILGYSHCTMLDHFQSTYLCHILYSPTLHQYYWRSLTHTYR